MPIPTSPEFVALCQAQLALLTQGLGASMGVVYWSEVLSDGGEPQLVPIAAAPEYLMSQSLGRLLPAAPVYAPERQPSLAAEVNRPPARAEAPAEAIAPQRSPDGHPSWVPRRQSDVGQSNLGQSDVGQSDVGQSDVGPDRPPDLANRLPDDRPLDHRLMLPLMHEGMVLGLLVTDRPDRPWSEPEQSQVNRVAQTLALASLLDQRSQWLEQSQQQQRLIQAEQQELMGTLLHQFRNPLTALRTFGKLLTRRLVAPDPNRDVATSIVRESDRLQELLLQFDQAIEPPALPGSGPIGLLPASIFSGELSLAPCDVAAVLGPLLESAGAVAQERGLTLHSELPSPLPLVVANGAALREVLSNLLDNALKYTPMGGEVHVRVMDAPDRLWIGVTDDGRGIPDADLPRLFERHFRGVQAQTAIPGTGLGLSIARHLMAQMGGDLQAFSPGLPIGSARPLAIGSTRPLAIGPIRSDQQADATAHRGTTFVVTLPR
jgi:signal transduction histidine kinase